MFREVARAFLAVLRGNNSTVITAIGWLKAFASADLVAKLEALAKRSPPDKAKQILTCIANARELAPYKSPDV